MAQVKISFIDDNVVDNYLIVVNTVAGPEIFTVAAGLVTSEQQVNVIGTPSLITVKSTLASAVANEADITSVQVGSYNDGDASVVNLSIPVVITPEQTPPPTPTDITAVIV